MFKDLLFDLDDTLLDFHKAEKVAVSRAFREVGVEPTDELIQRYSAVNTWHWEQLEKGLMTREYLLVQRFRALFQELGLSADPVKCQELYEEYLCIGYYFMEGAQEILEYLKPKYQMYLASNGTARIQYARLQSSGIGAYLSDLFISEELEADKPSLEFFRRSFAKIQDFDPNQTMMIGDRLTSDILGGIRAGIHTCWYNPGKLPGNPEIQPDYEIHSLLELKNIL